MTRTLLERTAELAAGLVSLKGSQLSATSRSQVEERKRELALAREKLAAPLRFIRAVEAREDLDWSGVHSLELGPTSALVERARVAARDDPERLLDGPALGQLLASLKNLANAAESSATAAWGRAVTTMMPAPPKDLLNVLAQIPAYRSGVEELRTLQQRVQAVSRLAWPSDDELKIFLELGRHAQDWWDSLTGQQGLPEPVLNFLVACAHDGAVITDITPDIAEWIQSRGLGDVFRVRFTTGP